ncbi:MAG TPA: hypothetical protein VLU73_15190, partial [Methylococcaceae bacterium]|nr:hypothetical protein [Methylococcaceae bacterium]
LILSVSHAISFGRWVAEMRFDPEVDQTLVHHFGKQWTAQRLDQRTSMSEELDFSFTEVPADFFSMMQERDSAGSIVNERPRHEFVTSLADLPVKDEIYAFTARAHPVKRGKTADMSAPAIYPGLKFRRTDGHYHIFELPVEHPGHETFKGCSGAPIVDRKRRIVALVCSGDMNSNTITGVSVHHIAHAIHAHIGGGG